MPRARRFFFYGTLQGEAGTPMARWLGPRFGSCERASVQGRMIAIHADNGWFPALLPGRSGQRISGTLCEIRLGARDLARLDRYEGGEYRRLARAVLTQSGDIVRAETYVWCAPLPVNACPVASGDFLAWLAATRRRPFSTPRGGH